MSFQTNFATPKLVGFFVMVAGLVVAVVMGRMLAQGNVLTPALIIGMLLGATLVLSLSGSYWFLLPVGFAFAIPAIPMGPRQFELWEVCFAAVTAFFVARLCMKREQLYLVRPANIPIFLFCAWVLVVYANNPAGFLMLGAGMGGIRFYLQIFFALMVFLMLSSKSYSEREAKIITRIVILGAIVTTAYNCLRYAGSGGENDADDFYSWHQALSLLPALLGAFLFTKYSMRDIFLMARPVATGSWLLLLFFALYSGKRAVLGVFLTYPFVSLLLKPINRGPAVFYSLLLAAGLAIVVIGNGTFFDLPLGMQRALSTLPGNWDPRVVSADGGSSDAFREQMRELAWNRIHESPWLGRGIGINIADLRGMDIGAGYNTVALLAAGGAWHSTIVGIMADLGIPALGFWIIYVIASLFLGYEVYRMAPEKSYQQLLAGAFVLLFMSDLLRSYTSGSAYIWCLNQWWMYGILVGMRYSLLEEKRRDRQKIKKGVSSLDAPELPGPVRPVPAGRA